MRRIVAGCVLAWACVATAQELPLRLNRVEVRDPAMENQVAFTLLVPDGWEVEAGVEWRPHQANRAVFHARVATPDGRVQAELFPVVPCIWTEDDARAPDARNDGDARLGRLVYPPRLDVAEYLGDAILPLHRHDVQPRLLDREPLDAVSDIVVRMIAGPGAVVDVVAERVRAGYEHQGQAYEEDFYVVLLFRFEESLGRPAVLWEAQQQHALSAPAEELDALAPLLHAIVASVRVSPAWHAGYLAVTRAATPPDAAAAHQREHEIATRTAEAIGASIGMMQTVLDPATGEPWLMPRVAAVWISDDGDVVLADDPDHDPDHDDGVWQRMAPAERP